MFQRLLELSVHFAGNDFRTSQHELIAFAPHLLGKNRELKLTSSPQANRVGGLGPLGLQGNIRPELALHAFPQNAGCQPVAIFPGEGTAVHQQVDGDRRLFNLHSRKRLRVGRIDNRVANLQLLDARDNRDIAGGSLLNRYCLQSFVGEKRRDLRLGDRAVLMDKA